MSRPRQYTLKSNGFYLGQLWDLREPGQEKPPRVILCTIEQAEYKTVRGKKVQRTEEQKNALLGKLLLEKQREYIAQHGKDKTQKKARSPFVKDLMQKWLDEISATHAPNTHYYYTLSTNHYIKCIGNHPIDSFKKEYKHKLLEYFRTLDITPQTQKTHLVQLQRFFNWAEEEEHTDRHIRLKKPKGITKKKVPLYTLKELKAVEKAIIKKIAHSQNSYQKKCYENHLRIFVLVRETACRAGEVWSLRLDRINLSKKVINLRDSPEINWQIKNDTEEDIPINPRLLAFLKNDIENRSDQEKWYLDNGTGGLLYRDPTGLTKAFRKLWHECGVEGVKPLHGIRATIITLVTEKYGVLAGRDVARHKNISTTDKHYVNIDRSYIAKIEV